MQAQTVQLSVVLRVLNEESSVGLSHREREARGNATGGTECGVLLPKICPAICTLCAPPKLPSLNVAAAELNLARVLNRSIVYFS